MGQSPVQNLTKAEKLKQIVEELEYVDDKTLNLLYVMMEQHAEERETEEDAILDYNEDGTPILSSEFVEEADGIVEEMKQGEFVTLEELQKKKEEWLGATSNCFQTG